MREKMTAIIEKSVRVWCSLFEYYSSLGGPYESQSTGFRMPTRKIVYNDDDETATFWSLIQDSTNFDHVDIVEQLEMR